MTEIQSDTRVRVAGGGQLRGEVRLPELDGVEPWDEPVLDRLGRVLGEHPISTGVLGIAGAVAAARGAGSIGAMVGRGSAGLLAGISGAVAIDAVLGKLGIGSSTPTATEDVAQGVQVEDIGQGEGAPERLKVVNWNVKELLGPTADGGNAGLEEIAAFVEREQPDVLVLQEVRRGSWLHPSGGDDLALLADRLGASGAVLVQNGTRPSGTEKGQAILTFGETTLQDARGLHHVDPRGTGIGRQLIGTLGWARDSGMEWIPDIGPGFHPRTTADAIVTTPAGRAVRLLDVHLSGTGGAATGGTPDSTRSHEQQLVPLAATVDAWDGTTLMMGDFNVSGGTAVHEFERDVLAEVGLRDAFEDRGMEAGSAATHTFPATGPERGIDRVYVSEDVRVRDVEVGRDAHARAGSDHLPIVAELELR